MSGFHTHMLIGAVGGLAAFKVIDHLAPAAVHFPVSVVGHIYVIPPLAVGLAAMLGSAYLALWPDIDEPGTHVSNQAIHYMWLFGALVGGIVMLTLSREVVPILAGAVVGAALGLIAGMPFLSLLRFVSGGHRRLTHSLVVGSVLFTLAAITAVVGALPIALPAFALEWGQLLHRAGDIETRGGVPLVWRYDFHLFPYVLARYGEPIAAFTALIVGSLLLLWR
jgi:membrane-bound metal-dependent hydrolase YbcI (DUF457 family)